MLKTLKIEASVIDFLALFGFRYLRGLVEGPGGQTGAATDTNK
jgi:hypothetical protein